MRRAMIAAVLAAGCLSGSAWSQSPRTEDRPAPPRGVPDREPDRERDRTGRPDQPVRTEKGSYLGVAASTAPRALRHQVELPKGVGLVVDAVAPDSPAAEAGLKPDDLLHKLNDQVLVNPQQLAVLVRTFKPGETLKLTVIRAGKPAELSAKLAEKDLRPLEEMRLGGDPFGNPLAEGWGPFANNREPGPELERLLETMRQRRDQPDRGPLGGGAGGGAGGGGGDPANPFPPGLLLNENFALSWDDGVVSMSIAAAGGKKTLVAKDKAGKELYNGPIDTEEQRNALPPEVKERLSKVGPPGLFRRGPGDQRDRPATSRPAERIY